MSLSDDPAPSTDNFDDVVAFVQAIYTDDFDSAGGYVADNSTAARYIAHQTAAAQVESLDGNARSTDPSDIDVTGGESANTVKVEDSSGESPKTYVWQNFKLIKGKIASWEVKGRHRSLDERLWRAKSSDKSSGVAVTLVSAYENNRGNVNIVIELASAQRNVRVIDASYTPSSGYRQKDAADLGADPLRHIRGGRRDHSAIGSRTSAAGHLTTWSDGGLLGLPHGHGQCGASMSTGPSSNGTRAPRDGLRIDGLRIYGCRTLDPRTRTRGRLSDSWEPTAWSPWADP